MKTRNFFLLLLFGILITSSSIAQIAQGEKAYSRMAYSQAAKYYEQGLKKDTSNYAAWSKMADSYRRVGDSRNAERAYAKVIASNSVTANDHYFYILMLLQNQRYAEAKKEITSFGKSNIGDPRAEMLEGCIGNLDEYLQKKNSYAVKPINQNGVASDICAVAYGDGIVFISDRGTLGMKKLNNSSTDRPFYAPYFAKGTGASFSDATAFETYANNDYHSGPLAFNAEGNLLVITRSSTTDGKIAKDDQGVVRLQMYSSAKGNEGWGIEVGMPFNSTQYSCMHPSLSADGKTLYFASDMPGGQGGIDIWKSEWDGSAWATPTNAGNRVNTIGDEVFPYITAENVLYFSSNGWPGLGGLDIYTSEWSANAWSRAENLGGDINSSNDDFGFTYNATSKTGYFSSNRSGQGINDDLFFFEKMCTNTNITITDEETGKPLIGATVKIVENGVEIGNVLTDDSGLINRCLNPSRNYEFISKREKYNDGRATLSSSQLAGSTGSASAAIKMKRIPDSVAHVEGRVFNADDKSGVAGLTVTLINKKSGETKTATTDASGKYRFEKLDIDCDYEVRTKKTDCGEPIEAFNTRGIVGTKTITMDVPLLCKNDVIQIDNIYYDYKKFDIRPDAAMELDKIVAILNKYPNMRIELRSHTDSRGNDNFNLKLSDDRANSAALYIIGKGIDSKRILAKGYGEKELLNKCKNGAKCDEKQHEENRRTEFKILSL
jgi:outer membrane protein OmpA-like peptidoglycan-associated protein